LPPAQEEARQESAVLVEKEDVPPVALPAFLKERSEPDRPKVIPVTPPIPDDPGVGGEDLGQEEERRHRAF
jgi:hypothetical protein